jgi:hypothetical protein
VRRSRASWIVAVVAIAAIGTPLVSSAAASGTSALVTLAASSRATALYYLNSQAARTILRRSFRTGHSTVIASGLNEPTGIVKVGDQLWWEQYSQHPCKKDPGDPDPGVIMSITLNTGSAKPRRVLSCITAEDGLIAARGFLYFAQENGIGRVGLSGHHLNRRFIRLTTQKEGDSLDGLATDGRHLYFSECDRDEIGRVDLNGQHLSYRFVSTGHKTCPQALAVGGAYLYWSDLGPIGRAHLNGTHVQHVWMLTHTGGGFSLAADAHHIYWDWQSGPEGSPDYVGRVDSDKHDLTKRWLLGQGPFLLLSPSASR